MVTPVAQSGWVRLVAFGEDGVRRIEDRLLGGGEVEFLDRDTNLGAGHDEVETHAGR